MRLIDQVDVQSAFPRLSSPMQSSTPLVTSVRPTHSLPKPGVSRVSPSKPTLETPTQTLAFSRIYSPQDTTTTVRPPRDSTLRPMHRPLLPPATSPAVATSRKSSGEEEEKDMTPGIGDRSYVQLQKMRAKRENQSSNNGTPVSTGRRGQYRGHLVVFFFFFFFMNTFILCVVWREELSLY